MTPSEQVTTHTTVLFPLTFLFWHIFNIINITIVLPVFSSNISGERTLMKMPTNYFKASQRAYAHRKYTCSVKDKLHNEVLSQWSSGLIKKFGLVCGVCFCSWPYGKITRYMWKQKHWELSFRLLILAKHEEHPPPHHSEVWYINHTLMHSLEKACLSKNYANKKQMSKDFHVL